MEGMFDQTYFDTIWPEQGVHRHDYCDSLADSLISTYGTVRFLDIGTGCGYLIKCLRDRGAIAFGTEISEYALANSCAPESVRYGDVRNLPFQNNEFDVVHSQGLWGYFPEEQIEQAWNECRRVGAIQHHNIDYHEAPKEHRYLFNKPKEWWDSKFHPKVLVACPNHEVKEYAFDRWISNIKSLTFPSFHTLVVDNSPTPDFLARWREKVPMRRIDTTGIEDKTVLRLNLSYEEIRKAFLAGTYERLMIIESDVIPPPSIIEFLLEWGRGSDWISHSYPVRGLDKTNLQQGIGCSLFSRRLMETFNFSDLGDSYTSDGGLWMKVRSDDRFTTMELWNYVGVDHLAT